jgi:hypothetical protein
MNRILTIALTASLLGTFMLAGSLSAATAPRTRTEAALRCRLGIGPAECGKNDGCNRGDGPLEKVEYLGPNAAGDDVYAVHYMHANSTYVISPPGPDGKIGRFWSNRDNPNQFNSSPMVHATSRAGAYSIYIRPQNAPPAGCSDVITNGSPPADAR